MDWTPLLLTFKLALITTVLLFIIALPLSYAMAFYRSKWSPFFEAIISMPLVLPPTVIGFYLLILLSPNSSIGAFLSESLGLDLVFSFPGLVIASLIYSLPFMVQPIKSGMMNLPESYRESAMVMGKSEWEILRFVVLPSIKPSLLTGLVLSFAHTIGEFGVVLMIGGSIPGETKLASIAIYDEVESLNYSGAHEYSIVLVGLSFLILLSVYAFNQKSSKKWWI
jgi:molybdate transport system permease protein